MKRVIPASALAAALLTLIGCGWGASEEDDTFEPMDSAWALTLGPLETYCTGLKAQAAKRGIKTFTEVELRIYAVWMFDEEVQNGGFSQYFYNPAGALAPQTVSFLRDVGAGRHADWLEEGLTTFGPTGPSADLTSRREQLDRLSPEANEQLDRLTDAIQQRPRTLLELLSDHLRELDPHRFN